MWLLGWIVFYDMVSTLGDNTMRRRLSILLGVFVLGIVAVLAWVSWNKGDDILLAGKERIRFQLQWFDQAQFIGFYVANEKRYYADEGLSVEVQPGGYNVNPIQRVEMSQAEIGLATADQVLLSKAEGHPLKAIGTVFNKSIACFISRKPLKIRSPQDLIGKKVGVYLGFDTENVLLSILAKHAVNSRDVNIVPAGMFEAFVQNEIEVFPSYQINEPFLAAERGIDVDILMPDMFGVQFYSDTIFTTEKAWKEKRGSLLRFLKASAKGWAYAESHPDEALDIMFRQIRSSGAKVDARLQKQMLLKSIEHLRGGDKNVMFYMDRARWDNMESSLLTIGKLKRQGYVGDLCDFQMATEASQ